MKPIWQVIVKSSDQSFGPWSADNRKALASFIGNQDFGPAGSWSVEVKDLSDEALKVEKVKRQQAKREACLSVIDTIGAYNDEHADALAAIDGAEAQTGQIIVALLAGRIEKSRDALQALGVSMGYPADFVAEIVSSINAFLDQLGPVPTIERDPVDEAVVIEAPAAPTPVAPETPPGEPAAPAAGDEGGTP